MVLVMTKNRTTEQIYSEIAAVSAKLIHNSGRREDLVWNEGVRGMIRKLWNELDNA